MSLCRFASVTRKSSSLLVNRAMTNALMTTTVLKRNFWSRWRRDDDKGSGKDGAKQKEMDKKADAKGDKKPENAEKAQTSMFNATGAKEDALTRSSVIRKDLDILGKVLAEEEGDEGFTLKPGPAIKTIFAPRAAKVPDEMVIPAIPLPVRPLLPGFIQTLTISDRATIQKLRETESSSNPIVGVFLRKKLSSNDLADNPDVIRNLSEICSVGTCAELQDVRLIGSNASIVLLGRSRIQIKECVQMGPPTIIKAFRIPPPKNDLDDITMNAFSNEIFSYTQLIASSNPIINEYLTMFMQRREPDNPLYFADFAGGLTLENRELQQKLLESQSYTERFETAVKLFNKELMTIRIQQELKKKVESNTKETERKYVLKEQMKVIQQQLGGDKDPKQAYIEKVNKKVEEMKKTKVSEAAVTAVEEELQRLSYTDIQSAEFSIIRNYIDWVTCLPWNKQGTDQMNLAYAEKVLNEDHYGLKDVKDRILEFIAVGKLQGHIPGKVLCFVGPPGTGKTSIAKSIARALGREYYQFSVGGANDVSQIKGHRRTYVGSMPGKLIHCLKTTKVNNPLILIDEVDKISASHQGDPASALLEVLDPNQNTAFVDNYIDVPVDFSKALFVCTANDISTVPQPLLDRMEVIRVSGYDYKEKLEISRNYLDKKARKATGLEAGKPTTPANLKIEDDALESLIRWYCREAGVRNLEKYIEKIYRKVAMKMAKMTADEIAAADFSIHEKDLEGYIGKRIFLSDRLYDRTPAGVVMGLAWTSMGGATLYIECQTVKPHPLDTSIAQIVSDGGDVSEEEDVGAEKDMKEEKDVGVEKDVSVQQDVEEEDVKEKEDVKKEEKEKEKVAVGVGHLTMTGQLGDVMKESIQVAYVNARHWMQKLSYSDALYTSLLASYTAHKAASMAVPARDAIFNILETSDIHMHLPEGATPKDGPSAGCAITTCLLSTALNRPIKQGLAMTGEISLNGKVLPVGGIKEKVMAARRAGINEIILPAENVRDVNELPEYVKENLTIHYAKTYENVLKHTGLCPEVFKE